MKSQTKRVLRTLLVFIPALYIMASLVTHCTGSNDGATFCTNTVTTTDSGSCQTYAEDNDCNSFSFDSGTCVATDCVVCTCGGTVTASDEAACTTYGQNFDCTSAIFSGSTCTVAGCENCDVVVDDTDDDYVIDTDDAAFDDF